MDKDASRNVWVTPLGGSSDRFTLELRNARYGEHIREFVESHGGNVQNDTITIEFSSQQHGDVKELARRIKALKSSESPPFNDPHWKEILSQAGKAVRDLGYHLGQFVRQAHRTTDPLHTSSWTSND